MEENKVFKNCTRITETLMITIRIHYTIKSYTTTTLIFDDFTWHCSLQYLKPTLVETYSVLKST